MDSVDAAAALTYANQIDPRVQVTQANEEVWHLGLQSVEPQNARWAIAQHYANANPNGQGAPVVNPAMIRRILTTEQQRAEALQRALEPPRNAARPVMSLRARDPERFDRLAREAAERRYDELRRAGIPCQPPAHLQ